MTSDAIADFVDAMRQHGLEPTDSIVADGELHRVRWSGDRKGTRNGAYLLHLNGVPAGFFQCFKRGIKVSWKANGTRLSPEERKAFAARMKEESARRQQEERERHQLVAKQAQALLEQCQDAGPDHGYLKRKRVEPHGLKVDDAGRLVVPLRDAKGTVWSVQTIAPEGTKLFLKGGRKKGLFHLLGEPGDQLVIAEGFATAASIREATRLPAAVAFDAGNLKAAGKAIREWLPLARVVIAADDDHTTGGNPGITKAHAAAEMIGAAVAVPSFPEGERENDFNDMATASGLERVAETIHAAFETLDDEQEDEPAHQPGPDPQPAPDHDWERPLLEAVEELNSTHFVARLSGQTVITSLVHDPMLNRDRLEFSKDRDIRLAYAHRHYLCGYTAKGLPIVKGLGEAWLAHRNRRTFERIALIPNGTTPPGTFNLWRGFGVAPKAGSWSRIRTYLLEVICAGETRYFGWLVNWCSYCVQHPERQAEVAVVLRGKKGTGKGTLGQILMRIFADHALHISNPAHFTGRFNAHLADTLLLFVDEAFWAGDRAGEGTLKALVTEPTVSIEAKYINAYTMPNKLKIIMASNSDWVVPASADERRFLVLDVSECHKQDREYFDRLYEAIDGAELPAFLDYLLSLDISDFDHRNPPHTTALNAQKLASADSATKFWLDCLTNGEIVGSGEDGWPEDVVAQELHAAYLDHARDHGDRHPFIDSHMAQKLASLMPGQTLRRIRPYRPYGDVQRPTRYALPSLDACRDAFLEAMRIDVYQWPKDEEAER